MDKDDAAAFTCADRERLLDGNEREEEGKETEGRGGGESWHVPWKQGCVCNCNAAAIDYGFVGVVGSATEMAALL